LITLSHCAAYKSDKNSRIFGKECCFKKSYGAYVAYSDLEHKRYFSYFTFRSLLGEEQLKKTTRLIRFYKTFRFFGLQKLFNKYPEQYERFWTYLFPAETIIAVLEK